MPRVLSDHSRAYQTTYNVVAQPVYLCSTQWGTPAAEALLCPEFLHAGVFRTWQP